MIARSRAPLSLSCPSPEARVTPWSRGRRSPPPTPASLWFSFFCVSFVQTSEKPYIQETNRTILISRLSLVINDSRGAISRYLVKQQKSPLSCSVSIHTQTNFTIQGSRAHSFTTLLHHLVNLLMLYYFLYCPLSVLSQHKFKFPLTGFLVSSLDLFFFAPHQQCKK